MPADENPPTESRRDAVIDSRWEVALRAGQEAEGEQGSVEDELAIIHLLRHAHAPQALDDAAFDRAWDGIDAELDEQAASTGWRAWLRRPWLLGGGLATAAAAAAVLVMVWSGPTPGPDMGGAEGGQIAQNDPEPKTAAGMSATIEAQFAVLEPGARAKARRSIDQGRSDLRGDLVAEAIRADGRTMGGAP